MLAYDVMRCSVISCSDYLFKLLLIGDSGVGKSYLLLRFAVSIFLFPAFKQTFIPA
jgi:GTPase SAR1 family protein